PEKAEPISPKKDEAKPKVVKKAKPEPSPEEILSSALKSVKRDVAGTRSREQSAVQNELKSLRRAVAAEAGDAGAEVGGGTGPGSGRSSGLMQVYASIVEKAVKRNWRYPTFGSDANLSASVEIGLDPAGGIVDSRIIRSSGRGDFDE
ncbi:MAG: TonB C-terminal domain-containing protein, partial [Desulfovibrionaceae bacterium]|nr:TonB C-terminal domain-containing protein [Desulfovibrionaceae bacterium]